MKHFPILAALAAALVFGGFNVRAVRATPRNNSPQETTGDKAKEDTKDAGHDTKNAAKKAGSAAKNGGKKGINEGAKGVKKGAQKTQEGAGKLQNKTDDNVR